MFGFLYFSLSLLSKFIYCSLHVDSWKISSMDFLIASFFICSVASLSSKSLELGLGSFGPRPSPAPSVWNQMRKTPEKLIPGIQMQNPRWERSTCLFLLRSRYHFVSAQTTQTDEIISIWSSSQLKRRGGGAGHNWPPGAGDSGSPPTVSPLSSPHPNSPTSGHGPKQPLLGPL